MATASFLHLLQACERQACTFRSPSLQRPPVAGERCIAVTYATDLNAPLEDLAYTAERNGYDFVVLGLGQPWPGFRGRARAYRNEVAIVAHTVGPATAVLLVDGYDAVINAPREAGLNALRQCGRPVLFGMETFCNSGPSNPNCAGEIPCAAAHSRFKYINAGVIMGRAAALVAFLDAGLATGLEDDQLAFGVVCQRDNGTMLAFDTERQMAANIYATQLRKLQWSDARGAFLVDGRQPCVLHYPATAIDLKRRESLIRSRLVGPHRRISLADGGRGLPRKLLNMTPAPIKWGTVFLGVLVAVAVVLLVSQSLKRARRK